VGDDRGADEHAGEGRGGRCWLAVVAADVEDVDGDRETDVDGTVEDEEEEEEEEEEQGGVERVEGCVSPGRRGTPCGGCRACGCGLIRLLAWAVG
jgi:hypothetical protein